MVIHGVVLTALLTAGAASPRGAELDYVKQDTREATRTATLARYMPMLEWSEWRLIGPFDNTGRDKHAVVYPPEIEIDLDGSYPGKGGRSVGWTSFSQAGFGPINLKRFGSGPDDTEANGDAICYLYREVVSDRSGPLTFEIGSDDGLKLWLNGRLLVDADAYRGLNPQDHVLSLQLKAGRNTVLTKITQGVGG